MSDTIMLKKLLGATFSHVDGDVRLDNPWDSTPRLVQSVEDILTTQSEAFARVDLSLETSTGEIAGFCMHFEHKDFAEDDLAKLDPSFIITAKDDASCVLVYLVEGSADQINQIISELNHDECDSFYADTTFPVPHLDYRLTDDDMVALDMETELPIYTPDEVFNALWVDDAGHAATVEKVEKVKTTKKAETTETVKGLSAETLNDATVYGDIPSEVWNLPIRISTGASQEEKVWTTTPEFKFGDLLTSTLSKHTVGKKNGQCFVTGAVADKKRNKNSVTGLYLLGLDVDSGASLDKTFAEVQSLGLCAVFYSTHSHLSTELRIKQDRFYKWCDTNGYDPEATTEIVRLFLREEDKYVDDVIDSAEYVETVHDGTGMHLVLETRPIEKFRIVFPLATPYIIAEQKKAQRDAILHWENMILSMGSLLGISVDRAARDPSRLFFLPRHPKDGAFRIMINGGKALDWSKIAIVDPRKEKVSAGDDPFDQAAAVMGGRLKGRPTSPTKAIDLMTWAAERADGFVISDIFKDYCDDRLREQTADGKYTCECPFDEEHSNAGDPDDKGCFIVDAGASSEQFNFRCSHDACSGRDRLKMLEKAMNDGWFPDSVLTEPKYDCMDRDEPVDEVRSEDEPGDEDAGPKEEKKKDKKNTVETYDRAFKLAEQAQPGLASDKIEAILKMCLDLSTFDRSRIITVLASKIKVPAGQLTGFYKTIEASAASGVVDDGVYDPDKVARQTKARFATLKGSRKPVVIIDEAQAVPTVNHFIRALSALNKGHKGYRKTTPEGVEVVEPQEGIHQLYRFGDQKVRIAKSEDGTFKPEVLTKDIIASIAKDHMDVVQLVDSNSYEPVILPEWIAKLTVVDPALNVLPLEGFATLPYYAKNHELVTKIGYNEYSQKILRMRDEVASLLGDKDKKLIKFKPTIDDVRAAKAELIDYVFHDFPFNDGEGMEDGKSSKAHLWCLMLQPLVRDLIAGPCPLYLVDKPSAGTGASLMVGTAMHIATGNKVGTTALSETEEEVRKAISANYGVGKQVIFFDNVNFKLTSAFFANLATAEVWEDRLLGQSDIISVKNRMQTIFAGNNVEASEENMRRMLLIKLDFMDDPTTASRKFKVDNLEKYVEENKTDLYANLLTIVNYWISKGAVTWEGKPLTGFESYCQIMGGILETCEIEGFLGNRHLSASANSSDRLAWNSFIQEWISKLGVGKPVSLNDIAMTYIAMADQPILYVNGGGRVTPTEDESRVLAPMQRVIDKQVNQIFRVYFKGEETKVSIRKTIDREKSRTVYAIELVEDRKEAA